MIKTLRIGLAMFAMLFGAGNVIFPLILGKTTGSSAYQAFGGFLLTSILVPFTGIFSMVVCGGDYRVFFGRLGKIPGFIIMSIVVAMIGPFGGIPRCIGLTYASLKFYTPSISLGWFSLVACGIIFFCCLRKNKIIDLLGYLFTPLLLLSITVIVIKGIFLSSHPDPIIVDQKNLTLFMGGLREGYNTMDLLGGIFFASVIFQRLKKDAATDLGKRFCQSAFIGASLLSLVYLGFGILAAFYGAALREVHPDQLLGAIGGVFLGNYGGFIVSTIVGLSCLTTAIALTLVSADFVRNILSKSLSYLQALSIVLCLAGMVSMLEFSGIMKALSPVLQVIYPVLIGLSIFNILSRPQLHIASESVIN